jgi:hypothetical protein
MRARRIVVVLLDDAIVDLDAEVEIAEEHRGIDLAAEHPEVEVGNRTVDIVLDHEELVVAAGHTETGEQQLVGHMEPVVDILEEAVDSDLVDPEEDTVAGREELNTHTADLVELLVALVEGSHKVVADVALEEVDDTPGQVVPVLNILADPGVAASMGVVVKSLCEIKSNSS